ncbi:creatininase family protein [Natronorarus salvus]|uniref:creatininase family protein n=1 Tax=Natronorarus salvus TaxID=3117733 RepID=UPI002F26141A
MFHELLAETWLTKPKADVRNLASKDGSILVVPVGATEQHGCHLPTGTDTILATAAAQAGADRVEDDVPVLLTPPLWIGYSPHHLPFGGTISAEHNTFVDTVVETVDSAAQNGFDAIMLLNGHGGNKSLLSTATSVAGRKNPDVEVSTLFYLDLLGPHVDDIKRSDVPGTHGGELETALMLSVCPQLVDEDEMSSTPQEEPYANTATGLLDAGSVSVYRTFDEYTESGTLGDPSAATAEAGDRALELVGDEIATILRSIHEYVRAQDP